MKKEYGDYGHHRRKRNPNGMTIKIVIAAAIICICAAIMLVELLVKRNTENEASEHASVLELEDIEESLTEDDAVEVASTDNSVYDERQEEESHEIADEEGEVDIQMGATSETGEDIDIAELVSASNVGENSTVTYGIDVSRFQGTIDWAQVASSGIDFAMIRVGYRDSSTGEIKADSNAKFNMQEAEKNGIKIGAYFFSTAVNADEAVQEANWVRDFIAQYPITYPVGYNCEGFDKESSRQYSLTKDERSSIAMTFLDQIYNAGYTPIFYASMGELAGDAKWNTSQIEESYKIWMAWYNQNTYDIAKGPAYDGQCAMWQYTNQGSVTGISKKVDVDVAYFGYDGTETAKDTSERETVTPDVEALMNFDAVDETVTAKNSTNLRDKPSQGDDSKVIVTLQNGQTAQRTGISTSGWSRVVFDGNTYYAVSSFLTTDLNTPKQVAEQPAETSGFKTKFADCSETVTAKDIVNLRSKPSVTDEDSTVVATLSSGDTALRTGINTDYGWSRVEYNGQTLYCVSSYLRVVE